MATRISTAARNAAVDAITALLNAGAGPGYIELRTGAQPASVGAAATGTLLATSLLDDPAFGAAAAGSGAAAGLPNTAAGVAAGDAGWFRAYDDNDVGIIDGSVTATGGGGDMELNTVTISVGVDVDITAWTITMPAG